MKITIEEEEYKTLLSMTQFTFGLLEILDRVDVQDDAGIASERFDLAASLGMVVEFQQIEASTELH